MAITYSDAFKNACLTGSGGLNLLNNGTLKIYTTGQGTELLSYTLGATAFAVGGTAGQAELQGTPLSDTALANGDAADYVFAASGGAAHITGTGEVTLSGGGGTLILSAASLSLTTGQAVDITAFTTTFP